MALGRRRRVTISSRGLWPCWRCSTSRICSISCIGCTGKEDSRARKGWKQPSEQTVRVTTNRRENHQSKPSSLLFIEFARSGIHLRQFCLILVCVPIKQLLDTALSQKYAVFPDHRSHLLIFDRHMVPAIEIVLLLVWNKWRGELFFQELVPGEIFEPRMFLYLVGSAPPESEHGLSLDKLVYEVGRLHRPSLGYVLLFYYCLLG